MLQGAEQLSFKTAIWNRKDLNKKNKGKHQSFWTDLPSFFAMAKWGVQDVLKELEDIDRMARLRTASTVVQQLVSSLKQKIQGMGRLTASTLVSITSALDNTVLSARVKEEISELLEQQVAGQGHSALKLQIQPQALNTVWNYVSASEWKQLQSCNSTDAVQILVRRLKASGLKSLKESTKKSGVALVVRLALQRGEAKPPAQEIYKLSMSFADSFHASTQAALVGWPHTVPWEARWYWRSLCPGCLPASRWPCPSRCSGSMWSCQFDEKHQSQV